MSTPIDRIAHKAKIRQARGRLNAIEEMRDARQLKLAGKSQREIADTLRTTQPRVHRMLRGAQALGDEQTPEELILRAILNKTARDVLVKKLSGLHYTFTTYPTSPHEGSVPGTWTQGAAAHLLGLITDEEYDTVCAAVQPQTP